MAVERKRITQLPVNSSPLSTDVTVTDRLAGETEQITLTNLVTAGLSGLTLGSVVQGYIYGLALTNNVTDATNDIDFAAGSAASTETNPTIMNLASALTKQLDVAWAVGNNQGGRMSAAAITNTTYFCYLIQRSDTGVVDCGFDVSPSAPTMPANYDRYRRIGAIVRTGGAIKPFLQNGDVFTWVDPAADVNTTNPGTSAVLAPMTLPVGLILQGFGVAQHNTNVAVADQILYISDPRMTNAVPDNTQYFTETHRSTGALVRNSVPWQNFCNTSGQVRYRLNASDAATIVRITTTGWIDTRGRV